MRPDASENSQISPSTIVRAARAAGSHPHLASVLLPGRKSANIHASSGVIRRIPVNVIPRERNRIISGVRYIRLFWFVTVLPLLAVPAAAQSTDAYMAPPEFMNLFFDFTGTEESDYPAGQPTLGQVLTQSVIAREVNAPGPLVLVLGSGIYVYESRGGTLLGHARFRADRTSGFYELTAISHIAPALAYLAQIKDNGDAR